MTKRLALACLVTPIAALADTPQKAVPKPAPKADAVHVVADCGGGLKSSSVGGYAIRIVSGGYVPGIQAYVHTLGAANSPASYVGTITVEQRATPKNATTVMILGNATGEKSTFELSIGKETVGDGSHVSMLNKLEVGTTKLSGVTELRCVVP